ncbi:hypothetical protein ACXAUS_003720 [Clostridium sporogenes]|uniref:hypothetical protein n=1 Tax=Clostridium sporogenes TaxID=1509 RepID=UPI0028FE832C|nr:hypothetical protein [Clostridium botulinum]
MAISSYQFRNQPYWLGFVFAGQAFTVSCRKIVLPGKSLNIQISTGKNTITHIKDQRIISQGEQLGIKLIKNPKFTPGTKKIPVINLDDRSKIKADTSFYYDASSIQDGIILEENLIPRFSFSQGGTPIESASFERILQYDTNYILQIKNEGFCSTNVMLNMAFYESGN